MGVINVTTDSFSDGGRFLEPSTAAAHAKALVTAGADLLDVGGESTRPGAEPVPERDEIARVVPVIDAIRQTGITTPITVDTMKASVARAALAAGANAVNDVSALNADPEMAHAVAEAGVPVCLMHMAGSPRTMQASPHYDNVVAEVAAYLERRMELAVKAGIARHRLAIDPGIGFGKTVRHNLLLIKHLDQLARLGAPVVLGTSRKSFIGRLLGEMDRQRTAATGRPGIDPHPIDAVTDRPVTEREWGTAASIALGMAGGARVVRVHDVAAMADVARVADAILRA